MPHRKTRRSFNTPGDAHALTFSCFRRQPFLSRDRSRQWLIDAIDRARNRNGFDVWAYVIMPEHVHLLIWPRTAAYNIGAILLAIKRSVSIRALHFVRRESPKFLLKMEDRQPNGKVHYRFWQRGGGYDFNVIEPQTAHRQIQYIHGNPVRRGLCTVAEDWYWSSAADHAEVRTGPLRIDRESVPMGTRD